MPRIDLNSPIREIAPRLHRIDFFHALSLLERLFALDSDKIINANLPSGEFVRIHHDPALSFNASDISNVQISASKPNSANRSPAVNLTTTFLGLSGTVSPLPAYFAEEVSSDEPDSTRAQEFLDIFHHRFLCLLYGIINQRRYYQDCTSSLNDRWSKRAYLISGFMEHSQLQDFPKHLIARFVPLLFDSSRTAVSLEIVLEDILAHFLETEQPNVRIQQFIGGWVSLTDEDRMHLGTKNNQLGINSILGDRTFVDSGVIKIHIEPLSPSAHRRLIPSGNLRETTDKMIQLFTLDPLDYELLPFLSPDKRPSLHLGIFAGGHLGVDSWLAVNREI